MTKAITQPPKGCRDFLPLEVRRREHVTGVIRRVYEAHGFEPVQTPALERLENLLGKYGEEGDQLLFKVLLRGQPLVEGIRRAAEHLQAPGAILSGRSGETAPGAEKLLADLGLRYDQTVPLARVYAAYQGKLPAVFKCYQIQPVWRADTPSKGRFREFYQCDADVMGSASLLVEAELAGAASQCLAALGFDYFKLRLNHRGLLRALVRHAGVPGPREGDAVAAIDKLDKIGVDGVTEELNRRGICAEASRSLLSMMRPEADPRQVRALMAGSEVGINAIKDIETVLELAEVTPAAGRISFDVTMARGLDYYTGCIFEIAAADLAGSLGGGGRYDNLIGSYLGKPVPACGFSLGLERILAVMEERGLFPGSLMPLDVVLAAVDEADRREALRLSQALRAAGGRVDLRPQAISPGKLRKYADEREIPFAVWLERGARNRAGLWSRGDGVTRADQSFERIIEIIKAARGEK